MKRKRDITITKIGSGSYQITYNGKTLIERGNVRSCKRLRHKDPSVDVGGGAGEEDLGSMADFI